MNPEVTNNLWPGVDDGGDIHRHRCAGRRSRVCVRRQPAGRPDREARQGGQGDPPARGSHGHASTAQEPAHPYPTHHVQRLRTGLFQRRVQQGRPSSNVGLTVG